MDAAPWLTPALLLAIVAQAGAFLVFALRAAWQASRVNSRIEALEEWKRTHSDAFAELASEIKDMMAELAKQGQALHDVRGWLQRIDGRLDAVLRTSRVPAGE